MRGSYVEAARKLKSSVSEERDEAMRELLAARDGAVPDLLKALDEPGAAIARISLLLSALGARSALEPLRKLYASGTLDADERPFVIRALAELVGEEDEDDDDLKDALLRASRESDASTRSFAAQALGHVGDRDAQARLKELAATDASPNVQRAALEALVGLKEAGRLHEVKKAAPPAPAEKTASPPADAVPPEIEEGGLALDLEALVAQHQAEADPEPVDFASLVQQANDEGGRFAPQLQRLHAIRWADRNAAVEELVQAGKEVVPYLIDKLNQPHTGARIGAAMALRRIGSPDAASALLLAATAPAHTDDERELRPIALKALANSLTGTEEGLGDALLPLTRDEDRWVRAGALLCLGRIADRVGIKAAVVALNDDDDEVKEAAAIAVSEGAREEDEDLVLPLLAILGAFPSPSAAVREAILVALSRIRAEADPIKVRLRNRVRPNVLGQTSSMRRMAISVLERCYSEDDPPPLTLVDDVLSRVNDEHPEVRVLAASFVSRFLEPGMTGVVDDLLKAIERHERTVGLLCLEALHRHDTPAAKAALEKIAAGADEALKARAAELLEGFEPSTEEWVYVEPEPEPEPEPEDEEAYEEAASDDEGVSAEEAAEALAPPAARVRAVQGGGEAAGVVEAVMAAPPAFEDDPSLRLKDRLARLRDAAGAGKLTAAQARKARADLLLRFADGDPAVGPRVPGADVLG